jgi:hypothetical protein
VPEGKFSNEIMYLIQMTGCQPLLATCSMKGYFFFSFYTVVFGDIMHLLILFGVPVCAIIQLWMRLNMRYCNYCSL